MKTNNKPTISASSHNTSCSAFDLLKHVSLQEYLPGSLVSYTTATPSWPPSPPVPVSKSDAQAYTPARQWQQLKLGVLVKRPVLRRATRLLLAGAFTFAVFSAAAWYTVGQAREIRDGVINDLCIALIQAQEQWLDDPSVDKDIQPCPGLVVTNVWLPIYNFKAKLFTFERWIEQMSAYVKNLSNFQDKATVVINVTHPNIFCGDMPQILQSFSPFATLLVFSGMQHAQELYHKNPDETTKQLRKSYLWYELAIHYILGKKFTTVLSSLAASSRRQRLTSIAVAFGLCILWQPLSSSTSGRSFPLVVQRQNFDDGGCYYINERELEILQASNLPHMLAFVSSIDLVASAISSIVVDAATHLAKKRRILAPLVRYVASTSTRNKLIAPLAILAMHMTECVRDTPIISELVSNHALSLAALSTTLMLVPGCVLRRYRLPIPSIVGIGLSSLYVVYSTSLWNACKSGVYQLRWGREGDRRIPDSPDIVELFKDTEALLCALYAQQHTEVSRFP